MKRIILFLVAAGSLTASTTFAQTYKPDFATKLVLAGGTTSTTNLITLQGAGGGSITYTFPSAATNGYVLTTDASGNLTWTNPATPTLTLTNGHIFVGNGSGIATD